MPPTLHTFLGLCDSMKLTLQIMWDTAQTLHHLQALVNHYFLNWGHVPMSRGFQPIKLVPSSCQ